MKSLHPTYKNYPFPIHILLYYIILSAAGIALLDMLAMVIILSGVEGTWNTLIGIVLLLLAFLVGWGILALIFKLLCGKKICRGIGLYHFANIISILCPITFIGIIAFMKATDMTYTFFNFATLFLECAVPPAFMVSLRLNTRRCACCGLINTFRYAGGDTKVLGTERKQHTEGGYYKNVKTSGTVERPWYDGGNMNVELTTQQYVPKTTVSDGVFEKKQTTTSYRCSVCGNVIHSTFTSETKIGD